MNKITEKIQEDADNLLFDIRHQMAILGRISMNLETIFCNAYRLQGDYNEETMDKILYYYEDTSQEDLLLDEIESDYDKEMIRLHKHVKELLDKSFNKTIDERYLVTEEKSNY